MTYYNQFTIKEQDILKNFTAWLDMHDAEMDEPVFISQFNFIDNSYDAREFDKIRPHLGTRNMDTQSASDFLSELAPVIFSRTLGYAFWAYRDIPNDSLYNSRFDKGLEGFESTESVSAVTRSSGQVVIRIDAVGQLWQNLKFSVIASGDVEARLLIVGNCLSSGELEIGYWDNQATIRVEPGPFSLEIRNQPAPKNQHESFRACLWVRCLNGSVEIERLALFNIELTNLMYDRNLTPRPLVDGVRMLNREVVAHGTRVK